MKRVAKMIVGYTIVIVLFLSCLALESCFIAFVIASIMAIIALTNTDWGIWIAIVAIPFGLIAILSAGLAIWWPFDLVRAWMHAGAPAT